MISRSLILIGCLGLFLTANSQNLSTTNKSHNVISVGNSIDCNGFRFNLFDEYHTIAEPKPQWTDQQVNGVNLALYASTRITNGLNLGLGFCYDSISNGAKIGIFDVNGNKSNGITIGGLFASAGVINGLAIGGIAVTPRNKLNGIAIGGMMFPQGDMNGLVISVLGFVPEGGRLHGASLTGYMGRLEVMDGFIFSPRTIIEHQHGFSAGLINQSNDLHGVQLGLWNIARNKKHLKALPFINMSFRKNS